MSNQSRRERTVSSALWAAYGDALGFPTELASASTVVRRLKSETSTGMMPWKKVVGGRFGILVDLPTGAYSDDTQLRLATARSIRGDGIFDVESFSKIELPVWLSYCLGAGRGSKAAASSLASRKVAWFSNFFSLESTDYMNGGGNGAAMRIQPHVWAAQNLLDERSYMADVVRNSVCTHGHLRGIAGAMIHAASLALVLQRGRLDATSDWEGFGSIIQSLPEIVESDSDLSTFWLPVWESKRGHSLRREVDIVRHEWLTAVEIARNVERVEPAGTYRDVLRSLGGLTAQERGSGLKCALFALVAVRELGELSLPGALAVVANELDSDTDTIATMVGALLGASSSAPRVGVESLQDYQYQVLEAERMFEISQGSSVKSLGYPDLLYWQAPRSPLDCVGTDDGDYYLAGLGRLEKLGRPYELKRTRLVFQWFETSFGQTLLCKTRDKLEPMSNESLPSRSIMHGRAAESGKGIEGSSQRHAPTRVLDLFAPIGEPLPPPGSGFTPPSLDDLTDRAIRSGFATDEIGSAITMLAEMDNGLELAVSYVAIVVKAKRARSKKNR